MAAGHVHARLSRKRRTQLPLPFLCTPSIARIRARSRSAADRYREEAPRHVCHSGARSHRCPLLRGRADHRGRPALRGTPLSIKASPGCRESFPGQNTRRGMSASAAAAEGSKAHSRVKALTGPLRTSTHSIECQTSTGYTASPPDDTRDEHGGADGAAERFRGHLRRRPHRVPLHVDTPANARARPVAPSRH